MIVSKNITGSKGQVIAKMRVKSVVEFNTVTVKKGRTTTQFKPEKFQIAVCYGTLNAYWVKFEGQLTVETENKKENCTHQKVMTYVYGEILVKDGAQIGYPLFSSVYDRIANRRVSRKQRAKIVEFIETGLKVYDKSNTITLQSPRPEVRVENVSKTGNVVQFAVVVGNESAVVDVLYAPGALKVQEAFLFDLPERNPEFAKYIRKNDQKLFEMAYRQLNNN